MLVKIAPDVYVQFVTVDNCGNKQLLVECMDVIWHNGSRIVGLL
jgi:hypothetical protein